MEENHTSMAASGSEGTSQRTGRNGSEGRTSGDLPARETAVVVLSISDYKNLVCVKPPFVDFIRNSPLAGIEISIERDKSFVREIKL